MPRMYYSEYCFNPGDCYEDVEYDEEISQIYENCSDDEKQEFIELCAGDDLLPSEVTVYRPTPATPNPQPLNDLETIIEELSKYTRQDIAALPDELIDVFNDKFKVIPESQPSKQLDQSLLNEIKLMFELYQTDTQPHPLLDEISTLVHNL